MTHKRNGESNISLSRTPINSPRRSCDDPQDINEETIYDVPEDYIHLSELAAPSPTENITDAPLYHHESLEERVKAEQQPSRQRHESNAPISRRFSGSQDPSKYVSEHKHSFDSWPFAPRRPSHQDNSNPIERTHSLIHGGFGKRHEASSYNEEPDFRGLNELTAPSPDENPEETRIYRHHSLEDRLERPSREWAGQQSEISPTFVTNLSPQVTEERRTASSRAGSRLPAEIFTVSYLVFFSILATLARLGLESLTIYQEAPVTFGILWVNFAGTATLGLLTEGSRLFSVPVSAPKGDGSRGTENSSTDFETNGSSVQASNDVESHISDVDSPRKPIPIYIGLTTGFCGSFTSYSSFIRDCFLALSDSLASSGNDWTSVSSRGVGSDIMALLAVIILTLCVCVSGLKLGAHVAIFLGHWGKRPSTRPVAWIDRCVVILALGAWAGAVVMTILPPDGPEGLASRGSWARETWRGQALFAITFAPLGCLLRFLLSIKLNPVFAAFPLGTFTANILGTAILGMAWDLQHAHFAEQLGCQVLQGIMDGFCGGLTTVSTWILELSTLRRVHAYLYSSVSVGVSLAALIAIMGTVKWTVGWKELTCTI